MTHHFRFLWLGLSLLLVGPAAAQIAGVNSRSFTAGELDNEGLKNEVKCLASEVSARASVMRGASAVEVRCTGGRMAEAYIFSTDEAIEADWSTYVSANYRCLAEKTEYPFEKLPLKQDHATQQVQVQQCQFHSWDRKGVALRVQIKGKHYYAIGLPRALRPMLLTIATLADWREREPASGDFPPTNIPDGSDLAKIDPYAAYFDAAQAAELYMAREDYAMAERELGLAIKYWNDAQNSNGTAAGARLPITLMLMRALAVSNQGSSRVDDARNQFKAVDDSLRAIDELPARGLYRVMDLMNQQDWKNAGKMLEPILEGYRQRLAQGGDPRRLLEDDAQLDRLRGARNNLTMQFDIPPSLTERNLLEVLDNYKAALYAQAEIRMHQGKRAEAIDGLKAGLSVIRRDIPSASAAYIDRTWSRAIYESKPDEPNLPETIEKLEKASETLRTIGQQGRPPGVVLLRMAAMRYMYNDLGRGQADFTSAQNALHSTNQFLYPQEIEAYLAALYQKSLEAPASTAAAYREQMLNALLLVKEPRVQQAFIDNTLVPDNPTLRKRNDLVFTQAGRYREINRLLAGGSTPDTEKELTKIRDQIAIDEVELAKAEDEISISIPAYRWLLRASVDIKKLQSTLGDGEAIVTFLMGENQTFGFLIENSRISVWRTDLKRQSAESLINKVIYSATPVYQKKNSKIERRLRLFDVSSSFELASGLFFGSPLFSYDSNDSYAEKIENKNNACVKDSKCPDRMNWSYNMKYKKLIIINNGPLTSFPFGVLVAEPPRKGLRNWKMADVSTIPWLVKQVPMHYLPSLRALAYLRGAFVDNPQKDGSGPPVPSRPPVPNYTKEYLGFGDPLLPGKSDIGSKMLPDCRPIIDGMIDFAANPENKLSASAELSNVKGIIGRAKDSSKADIFLGMDFTAARIKEMGKPKDGRSILDDYRYLHFASHAFSASDSSCLPEPGIQVTAPNPTDQMSQIFLSQDEISRLQMKAELVVLSACSTSTGASAKDEPLSGLVNAFLTAGARGVVTTFWDATDDPSRRTIEAMFRKLEGNKDLSTAAALQEAQMEIMGMAKNKEYRDYAHPSYWAVFGLVGDSN